MTSVSPSATARSFRIDSIRELASDALSVNHSRSAGTCSARAEVSASGGRGRQHSTRSPHLADVDRCPRRRQLAG